MRGNTAESGVERDQHGATAPTERASGERRPSVLTLQSMLKKVSENPLHSRYTDGEDVSHLSAAAADVSDDHLLHSRRTGVGGGVARVNPFYTYYLEMGSNGHVKEDTGRKMSEEVKLGGIFIPPPDYQSSPVDLQSEVKTTFSGPQNNFYRTQTDDRMQDLFPTSTLRQNATANGSFRDVTPNSPDLFGTNPAHTQNLSDAFRSQSTGAFKGEVEDLFYTAKGKDLLHSAGAKEPNLFDKPPTVFVDPFRSPSNEEGYRFQPLRSEASNPFYTAKSHEATDSEDFFHVKENKQDAPTKERDLFGTYSKKNANIYSSSSTDTVDPFPSPLTRNLFQDVSSLDDAFGPTPSKQYDPYQDVSSGTPGVLQPLPSKTNGGGMFESYIASKATYSTPSLSGPSEMNVDMPSSPDLFKKAPPRPPPPIPPKPFQRPQESPGAVQPTPVSRARSMSASLSQSPADETHVFRRPPKPLPRTRPPRPQQPSKPEQTPKPEWPPNPEKPPKPERPPQPAIPIEPEPTVPKASPKPVFRPLPKPVIRRKPKTPESKPVDTDNYVVFEDILLIGQEKCVEDWPEDSPELHPDFRPSGRFRLRRESMKLKVESDGGSGEDQDGTGSHGKKKDKKFRKSLLSRRGSKDKLPDDVKEERSRTLPLLRKSSKEYNSDPHMSAGDNDYEEENETDYKKKPLKTKVSQLLRRSSTSSSVLQGKHTNGHLSQELKDDGADKKSGDKKSSTIRRWSEGTALNASTGEEEDGGEAQHDEKKKKKLKIKFVPRRGFAIISDKANDEPKGAHGYTPRKGSQENVLDDISFQKKKSSFSAEELDHEELNGMEDYKPDMFAEDDMAGRDFTSPGEMFYGEPDELDTCKPKKTSKLKGFKKHKSKSKAMNLEPEDPPAAASSDYLSEAAQAEWRAAQMDEYTTEGLEDEDEEGDTDSLMEWWYTVEQWDEVPSDEEGKVIKEDESKSFSILADKVQRGLRVFNKVFTERAEVLWQSVIMLHAIADDISEFHHKARIAGITGGTTTAVGGVAAIAGLALAPFTFGASLVITAVGVGVATAGGITSASAAISDNVNNMHDRKKVEVVLQDYEVHLLDIGKILHFINQGVYKLRGHPFLGSGTQHYSQDWETRRAVQMISLVDSPVMRATAVTDSAVTTLQGLFKGMDKYFTKDSRELKKGCKKEIVGQIKAVADVLNDAIVELNGIREELQEATGHV